MYTITFLSRNAFVKYRVVKTNTKRTSYELTNRYNTFDPDECHTILNVDFSWPFAKILLPLYIYVKFFNELHMFYNLFHFVKTVNIR